MKSNQQKRKMTLEQWRQQSLLEKRRTMRMVRNTLLVLALIAGLWYLFLLWKDSQESSYEMPPTIQESPIQEKSAP